VFPLLVAVLIGVTVPERLVRRQNRIEARVKSQLHAIARAQSQYRERYGTLPSDLKDLSRLPDPDGSIAAALKNIDLSGYKPTGEMAAKRKPRPLSGAVIREASVNSAADDTLSEVLSFTNYELRLPGADKTLGTDDDLLVRDGLVFKASEDPKQPATSTASSKKQRP
jgi:type II secretory pathway pseudopilin PulG